MLERAIWRCKGIDPNGKRPETDAKPISQLLPSFKKFSENLEDEEHKSFIQLWCAACASGFIIRNNIVHGVAVVPDEILIYSRNPCWHGERRKREFGDFWIDASTLDMVCESFAVLFRIIVKIERERKLYTKFLHHSYYALYKKRNQY